MTLPDHEIMLTTSRADGYIADKFGYKKTMIGALCLVTVFIFVPFFSPNIHVLLLGQILLGIPFGIFQTLTCTYASEVCPTQLRAYMTTWVNLSWIIGQILASGVLRGTVAIEGQWSYRIPMALQWVWPIPLIIGISFAPESPWYLVRKGRIDQARHSILRLTSKPVQSPPNSISATNESSSHSLDIEKTLALMIYTNNLEIAASAGTSYLSCFRRTDLRRTELTCFVWAIQVLCGSTLMSYSTYFYLQAGLDVRNAFTFTLGQYCLGFIGTLLSWGLMGRLGRRTLYLSGQITMVCLLLIIGFTSFAETGDSKYAASWAIGSMLLVFTFVYDCTVGPVCYSLVTELPSTRLKTKTVVLARTLYNISGIVVNITSPLMLNPTAWHWGAKSGFFWAGIATLCVFWTFFRLPEPKGRTYAELDVLFEAGVKARKFKGAVVEGFAGRVEGKANNGEGVIDGNEGAGRDEKRS